MGDVAPLTILVKAPNLKAEDKRVACDRSWSVRQLKEHLSTIYPDKPPKNIQKLVYFGKLLKDDSFLREVLTQDCYDNIHTVHLVCPAQFAPTDNEVKSQSSYVPQFSSGVNQQASSQATNQVRHRSSAVGATSSNQNTPSQRSGQSQQTPATDSVSSFHWNSRLMTCQFRWTLLTKASGLICRPLKPTLTPQQRLWAQMCQQHCNMYNLHLQSAAMQYYAASTTPTAHNLDANQPEVLQAQAAVADGDDVVQLNAQGGVDAQVGQRDWLDTVYNFARFGMLLVLLYFYTTFGRFSIVLLTAIFFYLVQTNFFRLQRRRPAPVHPQPPQNEQNQAENQNNENNERANGGQIATEPNNNIPVTGTTSWFDVIRVICNLVMTFFTSLIPQNPAAVAN
ncbi:HERPUD2 [Bugula neritina]|uniref:HERPUD2 n=1 Tax=Bugula neritina TaxID=10212 RepID=A0A7J7K3Z2_BUGNE|nr:HERPUD2 [Bugula neritina]